MKTLVVFGLLCSVAVVPGRAQISVDLTSGPPYKRTFETHAANGDQSALTPEAIASVNAKLAAEGNTEAAFQMGLAYAQGLGITKDLAAARKSFDIGATTPEEKAYVAEFYRNGEFFQKDLHEAGVWYQAAGRAGDLFELAQMYRTSNPPLIPDAAALYRELLSMKGNPEVRRAEMELGNLVLDGKYSAGEDDAGRALNLKWARVITQELLGQQEYTIAVAYDAQVDGVPKDEVMWRRFCQRAAAYNIDLAQEFMGEGMLRGGFPGASLAEGYAWLRLSADKRYANKTLVDSLQAKMSQAQRAVSDSIFEGLIKTHDEDGAYYRAGDPLRDPSVAQLAAMPDSDPDVLLRRAFDLERSGKKENYLQAMGLYRTVRDRREIDIKLVLSKDYELARNGVSMDQRLAKYWRENAEHGPEAARSILK